MKKRKEYTCPLEYVHDIIRGKWKTIILYQLYYLKKSSLADLRRNINGISERVLLQQLKELQEYGLVQKKTFEGYPLKVEYSLSDDKGYQLVPALEILQSIGQEYLDEQNK